MCAYTWCKGRGGGCSFASAPKPISSTAYVTNCLFFFVVQVMNLHLQQNLKLSMRKLKRMVLYTRKQNELKSMCQIPMRLYVFTAYIQCIIVLFCSQRKVRWSGESLSLPRFVETHVLCMWSEYISVLKGMVYHFKPGLLRTGSASRPIAAGSTGSTMA